MYEIIIKRTETVTKKAGKEWKVIGQRPVTDKDMSNTYAGLHKSYEGVLIEEHGYTPEIEKEVEVTEEIYRQSVQNLDLATVVKAVNGIA